MWSVYEVQGKAGGVWVSLGRYATQALAEAALEQVRAAGVMVPGEYGTVRVLQVWIDYSERVI